MNEQRPLSAVFVRHASDFLAENGLTGSMIVRTMAAYAIEFNVDIPHGQYPFQAPNKRTALFENLMAFSEPQTYRIIYDLCNHGHELGTFVKQRGGSAELSNMFVKLVEYSSKYQNTDVKHDDAVFEEEVEFVLEITVAFRKHLVRISARD